MERSMAPEANALSDFSISALTDGTISLALFWIFSRNSFVAAWSNPAI